MVSKAEVAAITKSAYMTGGDEKQPATTFCFQPINRYEMPESINNVTLRNEVGTKHGDEERHK